LTEKAFVLSYLIDSSGAICGPLLQVHVLEDGSVHIYSRNLESTTAKYPDIVARMASALAQGVKSIVLDGEVQAWDPERKTFLPFQDLTTRKRKNVKEEDVTIQASCSALSYALHALVALLLATVQASCFTLLNLAIL
jgi:DNA ligase-1